MKTERAASTTRVERNFMTVERNVEWMREDVMARGKKTSAIFIGQERGGDDVRIAERAPGRWDDAQDRSNGRQTKLHMECSRHVRLASSLSAQYEKESGVISRPTSE